MNELMLSPGDCVVATINGKETKFDYNYIIQHRGRLPCSVEDIQWARFGMRIYDKDVISIG